MIDERHLAWLFYSGVPWVKLTREEQDAFNRLEVSRVH